MKIVFTGGGTGGHFYPIIAIVEAINKIADEEKILGLDLYYISDDPYNKQLLLDNRINYIEIATGKRRTYFSFQNFLDLFKIFFACINATWKLFSIYPDVVFGKGGYASFPALFAARLLRIPVIIHESDITLGRVNRWVSKYALRIAISYPETAEKLGSLKQRAALIGIPIRRVVLENLNEDPFEKLSLERDVPVLLILGGSQGAESINENIMDIMDQLVEKYQIIHQTGEQNLEWMQKRAEGVLANSQHKNRYKPYGYMDAKTLRLASMATDLVISRSGSTIFEIALWGKASILIPLPIAREDHQRENSYSYARTGAATVIEEQNLRPGLLYSVIDGLMKDPERRARMAEATKEFAHTDAAEKIAKALVAVALKHE